MVSAQSPIIVPVRSAHNPRKSGVALQPGSGHVAAAGTGGCGDWKRDSTPQKNFEHPQKHQGFLIH